MPGETEPLRNEVRIAAPPEVVYAYFTDPVRIVHWMGVAALLDPRPGGTFRVEANGRDVVIGEYVEVDPPHRGAASSDSGETVAVGEGRWSTGCRARRSRPARFRTPWGCSWPGSRRRR